MRRELIALAVWMGAGFAATAASAQQGTPCNIAQSYVHGCLATVVEGPVSSESGAPASKEGRACAWNVLRLVAVGDMRITTAQRNGGIARLATVDFDTFELIPYYGVLARYCTVARGD